MIKHAKSLGVFCVCCFGLLPAATVADDLVSNKPSDGSADYEIEEMVITAKEPDWRKPKDEQEWRPDRFELPEGGPDKRMEWFPEYTRDERDNFDQPFDPLKEKPGFQLFKWKF
jgi:hypothetical protein